MLVVVVRPHAAAGCGPGEEHDRWLIGELLSAAVEERAPSNSGRHDLLSLERTPAARSSAGHEGARVAIGAYGGGF